MKKIFCAILILSVVWVSNGFCQGAAAPAQGIPPPPSVPTASPIISEEPPKAKTALGYKSDILDGFYEEVVYLSEDRRDPFSPYQPHINLGPVSITHPLQRFALEQLKIIGIIWNTSHPKALILDPAGTSYVVLENDRIGNSNGYVAKIREGEIVVVEEHMDTGGNKAYLTKLLLFKKN